jgi:hypothetical protein
MLTWADQGQTGWNADCRLRILKYLRRQGSEGTHRRISSIEKTQSLLPLRTPFISVTHWERNGFAAED